jgi:hypothetical protein
MDNSQHAKDETPIGNKVSLSTWRKYCTAYLGSILAQVDTKLPPSNNAESSALSEALGNAARHGEMPYGFGLPGACAGYTRKKLLSRCGRVADALFNASVRDKCDWLTESLKQFFLHQDNGRTVCEVISIGGGPAFDLVAIAMLSDYLYNHQRVKEVPSVTPVHGTVLDYELGWSDFATTVASSLENISPVHKLLLFGKCDITQSLNEDSNIHLKQVIESSSLPQIYVASYVVAENASALRETEYIFFQELFEQAPPGSLFIFCETTHRLWPDILRVAFAIFFSNNQSTHDDEERFRVTFPSALQHGSAMLLSKPSTTKQHTESDLSTCGQGGSSKCLLDVLSSEHRVLLERFENDNKKHMQSINGKKRA